MIRMTSGDLRAELERLDRRPYPAYKDLRDVVVVFQEPVEWELRFDRIQGDPFAAPSWVALRVRQDVSGFPANAVDGRARRIGVENLIAHRLGQICREFSSRSGSGRSGLIYIDAPGQEVIARTAVRLIDGSWEARLSVGLPGDGRRIAGCAADRLLRDRLGQIVARALLATAWDPEEIRLAADTNEDAEALRAGLRKRRLVGFVADGAILPRAGGNLQTPLFVERAEPFV
ncbi:MAG: ABC-ATPase domain-containing protein, partial [Chthoniobacterales bacterium]